MSLPTALDNAVVLHDAVEVDVEEEYEHFQMLDFNAAKENYNVVERCLK